jgi:hypothetical protein
MFTRGHKGIIRDLSFGVIKHDAQLKKTVLAFRFAGKIREMQ